MEFGKDEEDKESKEEGEEEIETSYTQIIQNQETGNEQSEVVPSTAFLELLREYRSPTNIPPPSQQPPPLLGSPFITYGGAPTGLLSTQMGVSTGFSTPFMVPPLSFTFARFELQNQPHSRQERKPGQSKYVLPNPVVIKVKESPPGLNLPPITGAFITVKLADREGNPLAEDKQRMLLPAQSSGTTQSLTTNGTATFSIKIRDSQPGNTFRLAFFAKYLLQGSPVYLEEKILSRSFVMFSKKGYAGVLPVLAALLPKEGTAGTEVWIRGSGFKQDNVVVRFGDVNAQVTESLPDLLTVIVPVLPLLTVDTPVTVTVFNRHNTDLIPAEIELSFLYRIPRVL